MSVHRSLLPTRPACAPRRTAQRPSAPVLQHASVLAARSAKALSKLLVPEGAAAYDAAGHVAEAAPAVWEQKLFCPALREFDVLILLRKEALPQADRALEAATRQLAALTGRRRRRGSSSSSAANAGGGGREAFASLLAAADAADEPPAPPKRSRAILRAFPSTIVASQGLAKLQQELLIGFDPVALFTTKLEERFGHLAVFCSDGLGGRAVGVKWRPDAFLPQPLASLRLATCHTAMPCATTAAAAGAVTAAKGSSGKKGSSGSSSSLSAVSVVPNVAHVVEEMAELGQGLVLDIVGAALSLGVVPNHPQPKSGTGR